MRCSAICFHHINCGVKCWICCVYIAHLIGSSNYPICFACDIICILVITLITLLFHRIGLEGEEEDVELCAYTFMGTAFKTTMVISPAIATFTDPERKTNFEDDSLCLSMITISINSYLQSIYLSQFNASDTI